MIGFFKLKYSDLNQEKNSVDVVIIKGHSHAVKVNILKFLYTKMKQSISQRRLQVTWFFSRVSTGNHALASTIRD